MSICLRSGVIYKGMFVHKRVVSTGITWVLTVSAVLSINGCRTWTAIMQSMHWNIFPFRTSDVTITCTPKATPTFCVTQSTFVPFHTSFNGGYTGSPHVEFLLLYLLADTGQASEGMFKAFSVSCVHPAVHHRVVATAAHSQPVTGYPNDLKKRILNFIQENHF